MKKHAPSNKDRVTLGEQVTENVDNALAFLGVADEVANMLDDIGQTGDHIVKMTEDGSFECPSDETDVPKVVSPTSDDVDHAKIRELIDNLDAPSPDILVEDDPSDPHTFDWDFYSDIAENAGTFYSSEEFEKVGELHRQIFSKRSLRVEVGTFLVLAFRTTPIRSWPKQIQKSFWDLFNVELKNFKRGLAVVKWETRMKADRGVIMHKMDRLVRLSAARAFDRLIHELAE